LPAQKDRFAPAAIGIVATALVVRLAHVWQMRASPFFSVLLGDSRGYDEWARRIAGGEWLGREVFYQAPLYPYMLGVVYAVAGRHLLLVRVLQAIIGSASCVLLGLAAARLFSRPVDTPPGRSELVQGRRAGLAAGLMLAVYAPAIFFDGLLQKSVLDVFFLCLALWLIATTINAESAKTAEPGEIKKNRSRRVLRVPRTLRLPSWYAWLGLGLTMGALALTRENALVFIVVILAWALFTNPESRVPHPESRVTRAALFVTGLAIILLPVAARNVYVGGGFYLTTAQAGPNFYIGNNPHADGTYQSLRFGRGAPEYERQDATELAERALGRSLTPGEVSSYWVDKAMDFITSRPGAWLTLMARKLALLWNATEMLDTESQEAHAEYSLPLRVLGVVGHFGILVPLAVLGAVVTWPMRRRIWILYAMTLAYAASVVLFYVFARYRYPLVPLLIIFAAAGVVEAAALFTTERTTTERTETNGKHGKIVKQTKTVRSVSATRPSAFSGRALWTAAAVGATAIFSNWPMLSTTLMRAVTETNLAVALQGEGRLDEATAHYQRAIALRPDYVPAYNNLGTALRAEGRLGDAVAAYQRAISLRPEYPDAHYNLANVLTDEGKAAEAADHFRVALRTISGSPDVHNNLGIALMAQGQRDEAIAEFRASVNADPASAKSHRNLADALASAQRSNEAIAEFRRAAELAPTDDGIRYDLGSLFLELDRMEEAIAEFRAALKLNPRSVVAHNNLGIALGSRGRMDEAIDQFRQALGIDPGFADAQRNLATAQGTRRRSR
jgi:tetratricopeptide (TPR) repeat protein/4-amino-4-deoxy-L-arabinose transferase-like glycosyltransferase